MIAVVTMVVLPSLLLALPTSGSGPRANDTDMCFRYDANGCSIPFDLYFFYKKCFTPSCNRHDICYSCGVAYNITRAKCDWSFRHDMVNTCRSDFVHSSFEKDTPTSHAETQILLRKKSVLSILDTHAGKFRSILEEIIPSYINLCGKLDKFTGTYEFIQRYKDHVVTQWAGLLNQYLQMKGNSFKGNRRLSRFRPIMSRRGHVVSISDREINAGLNNKHFNTFVFNQVKERATLLTQNPAVGAILECCINDTAYCQHIQKNVFSSRSYDLRVELHCAEINLLLCMFFSEVYYLAVDLFGSSRFDHEPKSYCNESFVPQCLPAHDSGRGDAFE